MYKNASLGLRFFVDKTFLFMFYFQQNELLSEKYYIEIKY